MPLQENKEPAVAATKGQVAPGQAPTRPRAPSRPAAQPPGAHSQLLVVLVGEVEEPGHVEEELGAVLQQQQDQPQAAQAGERASWVRPGPGGPGAKGARHSG